MPSPASPSRTSGVHTGSYNNAFGAYALNRVTSGYGNNAFGDDALANTTTASDNTAVGDVSLATLSSGSNNAALGASAGASIVSGSNNIILGAHNQGQNLDSGIVRIGAVGLQTTFFAAGIRGVTTGIANAVPVVIDSNGQLGTVSSSRRFKEDIRDMGDASRSLFALRPVTFRYTKAYNDGGKPIQYGLVAEEVAEVFPDLAVKNAEGGVDTVHYETLSVLLLNEVKKQHDAVRHLQEQNRSLDGTVSQLQELNRELADRLAAVEALLSGSALTRRTADRNR